MKLLSEDDLNLAEMSDEELDGAWDLWFDLAQETNDWDPPYTHGVLVLVEPTAPELRSRPGDGQGLRGTARDRC